MASVQLLPGQRVVGDLLGGLLLIAYFLEFQNLHLVLGPSPTCI